MENAIISLLWSNISSEKVLWKSSSSEKVGAMEGKVFLKKLPLWKSSYPEKVGNAQSCFSEKLASSKK